MLRKYISTTIIALLGITVGLKAQYNETILKAMSDELERNKQELVYKDYNKPFFIAYMLYDLKIDRYASTLGGQYFATHEKRKSGNVRVMTGDYQLTDENFSDRTNNYRHNDGYMSLPYEVNYDGIRRHFWLATNNIYKNAAESYRNKVAALKHQNMAIDDLPAYDFSEEQPQQHIVTTTKNTRVNVDLGKMCEVLSNEFKAYPDIINSSVNITNTEMYRYYINSEGTRLAVPEKRIHFEITCMAYNTNNEPIHRGLYFDAMNKDNMLPLDTLKANIHALIDQTLEESKLDNWNDSYTGPVLFENQTIYNLLLYRIFNRGNGFIATRENLIKDRDKIYLENQNTLESRLDKKIASTSISIYDIPKLKTYKNQPLMGYYTIDNEGVIPNDTLTLVESGKLKSLLSDRIPLKNIPHSNGHSRTCIHDNGNVFNAIGPGNIFVKSSETSDKNKLKKKLRQLAEEEGLDYAIIMRPSIKGNYSSPLCVYKVDLKTGNETRITGINTHKIALSAIRHIVGASDQEQILNLYHNYQIGKRNHAITAASFVYPDALLIENIELSGYNQPVKRNPPVISNPLTFNH